MSIENTIKRNVDENKFMSMLDMELTEVRKGYVKGRMKITDKLYNPYGTVHGGALFSLADAVAGAAAGTYGIYATTISSTINYIRPATKDSEYVYCIAEEFHQGSHVSVYNFTLMDEKDMKFGTGTFTMYMLNRKVEE